VTDENEVDPGEKLRTTILVPLQNDGGPATVGMVADIYTSLTLLAEGVASLAGIVLEEAKPEHLQNSTRSADRLSRAIEALGEGMSKLAERLVTLEKNNGE
jgi:hypothetical protein